MFYTSADKLGVITHEECRRRTMAAIRSMEQSLMRTPATPLVRRPAWCCRVLDGDTLELDIDYPIRERPRARYVETCIVRICGVDACELRDQHPDPAIRAANRAKARAAAAWLRELIAGKDCAVELIGPDKYGGRWDGKVYLADGTNLASSLITAGHGVPYAGGRR
jgi:endonuclease YncB( thermonuclease family)